jgi:multidrug efflux pump subunit AcrA (membrane-fusion protein)
MNTVVFDTHAFVKRLTAVGMPEAQAEVLADEQRSLIDERLATKEDIAKSDAATKVEITRLEAATKAEIGRLEAETEINLAETKYDILKWIAGIIGFQTIVTLGAVFALLKFVRP